MSEVKEKFGIFKELVGLFDTKLKATITTILALAVVYLVWKKDNDKDRLYNMVIEEVRKQVPAEVKTQTAPIKAVADSNRVTVKETKQMLDTVVSNVKTTLKSVNKKIK